MASTPSTITITGTQTDNHLVSIEILTDILSGIQKTVYLLAAAKYQPMQNLSRQLRLRQEIKQRCMLQVGITSPGSYQIPLTQMADLLQSDDWLGDLYQVLGAVVDNSISLFQKLVPDSRLQERILREMARFLPKSGSDWELSFQYGDQIPLTLNVKAVHTVEDWLTPEEEQNTIMTVTGELIRIDFDKNILTLRYPPTAKELECSYLPDLENTIIEQRRELIQVTGRFTLDETGHPKRLSDVYRIESVDLSPMTFRTFEQQGRALMLHQPLVLTPMLDETQQLFVVSDELLAIYVYAQIREQIAHDLTTEIFFLWDEYGQEHPDQLTQHAQQLRIVLLQRFQEITNAA